MAPWYALSVPHDLCAWLLAWCNLRYGTYLMQETWGCRVQDWKRKRTSVSADCRFAGIGRSWYHEVDCNHSRDIPRYSLAFRMATRSTQHSDPSTRSPSSDACSVPFTLKIHYYNLRSWSTRDTRQHVCLKGSYVYGRVKASV